MGNVRLTALVSMLFGGLAGVAASAVIAHGKSRQTTAPSELARESSAAESRSVAGPRYGSDVRDIRDLASVIEAARISEASAQRTQHQSVQRLPPKEQGAREQAAFETQMSAHKNQARDSEWAQSVEAALGSRLSSLGETAGFHPEHPDCRTDSCSAVLHWSSYNDVGEHAKDTASAALPVNCQRHLYLPNPADPTKAYDSVIILDHCVRGH
jgi:hypothetical protein